MKNIHITILFSLFSMIINAQTIDSLSVASSDIIEGIDVTLEVCYDYAIDFINDSTTVEGDEINLTVCYHVSDAPITDCDLRVITVSIDPEVESYTLNVYVYKSLLPTECDYSTLTDTATLEFSTPLTESVVLSISENELSKLFQIYPNPTKDILFFDVKNDIQILSISLFNMLGSKIVEINNPTNKLNLSNINTGVYFINIQTDKGKFTKRLVKE